MIDNGFFQINDIVLDVPPTEIKIAKNAFDQRLNNLRTVGASVIKSKFSTLNIHMSVIFTDENNGYDKLRNLVSQLRLTPFCYVKNRFLAEAIFGNAQKSEMVLALNSMSISMAGGDTVNAIKVLFVFNYFNHKAYVEKFEYKQHLFGDGANVIVDDPKDSEAWKLFYKAEQERRSYKKSPVFTNYKTGKQILPTTMGYWKYSLFTAAEIKGRLEEAVAIESSASYSPNQNQPTATDSYLNDDISSLVRRSYPMALSLPEQIEFLKDDIGSSMLRAKDFNLSPAQIVANSPRHHFFAEDQGWKALNLKDGSLAKFTMSKDGTSPRTAAKEASGNDLVVCYKSQKIDLEQEKIIPVGVSISFSNRLAPIPLVGSPYATFQYLGGSDATVSMSFLTTSNEALENISKFHNIWKEQKELMRSIPMSLRRISVTNDLLNMCGLHEFHLQGMEISTVPGQPETKQINFDLIENGKPDFSDEKLTYERITPGLSLSKFGDRVFRRLIYSIDRKQIDGSDGYEHITRWRANSFFSKGMSKWAAISPKWNVWWRDDVGTVQRQVFKSEDGFIRHGNFSRHSWNSNFEGPASSSTKPEQYEEKVYSGKPIEQTTAEAAEAIENEEFQKEAYNKETIETKEYRVLFPYRSEGHYADAYRNIFIEFNVIYSQFVVDLLSYRQGLTISTYTAEKGAHQKSKDAHQNPLAAKRKKLIQQAIDSKAFFGIKEAKEDVEKILKFFDADVFKHEEVTIKYFPELVNSFQGGNEPPLAEQEFVMLYNVKMNSLIEDILKRRWDTTSAPFVGRTQEQRQQTPFDFLGVLRDQAIYEVGINAYPDFPMTELLNAIRAEKGGTEFLKDFDHGLNRFIDDIAEAKKYLNINTFFGPDFYLKEGGGYNDVSLNRSLLRDASNKILKAYSGDGLGSRKDEVNSWLQNLSKTESAKENNKILEEITERFPNSPPAQFLPPCGDREDTLKNDQTSKSQTHVTNARLAQEALTKSTGSVTALSDKQKEQAGIPKFIWPTPEGYKITTGYYEDSFNEQGRVHKALDIAPGKNWPSQTPMSVFAVASGWIVKMTKIDRYESTYREGLGTSLGEDKRFDRQGLRDKKIPLSASGKILNQGLAIEIKHENGWVSKYYHLKDEEHYQKLYSEWISSHYGIPVEKGQHIGFIGSTGRSTGPHLHLVLSENGKLQNPKEVILESKFKISRFHTDSYLKEGKASTPLEKAHEKLGNSFREQRTMLRAYPTYKLFFVESDYGERHFFGADDFFSYQAVQDIQIVKSANNPADLMVVRISNLGGYLTNRRFKDIKQNQNKKGEIPLQVSPISGDSEVGNPTRSIEDPVDMLKRDTEEENPLESLFLKEGLQVQMRMGFSPNPAELEIVFDGLVMDIQFHNTDEVITLTCQSFGMELVAGVLGMSTLETEEDVEKFTEFKEDNSTTDKIVSQLLEHPTLKHFGRWQPASTVSGKKGVRWDPWTLAESITDSNVFIPEIGSNLQDEESRKALVKQNGVQGNFKTYRTTIWDSLQQLSLRHPGYIVSPVSYQGEYGPRSTLYFGLPSGQYICKDATLEEKETMEKIEELAKAAFENRKINQNDIKIYKEQYGEQQDLAKRLEEAGHLAEKTWHGGFFGDKYIHTNGLNFSIANTIKKFAESREILKPFRSYHIISNETNLISNNIISSAYSTFNAATIEYQLAETEGKDEDGNPIFGDPKTLSVKADPGIPDEEIREIYAGDKNCISKNMAKNYAQALLWKSMKKGYRGSFTISGNPEIKPHDICYIYDSYTDMYGPVEVEQVVHRFSYETGFLTEIVPMMCIQTNETSTMATMDVLGIVAENYLYKWFVDGTKGISDHEFIGAAGYIGTGFAAKAMAAKLLGYGMSAAVGLGTKFLIVAGSALAFKAAAIALFVGGTIYGISSLFDDDAEGESNSYIEDFGLFISEKFITRTQMAQLFEYSPLIVRGRPLLGGLPTRTKSPGTFIQNLTKDTMEWWHEGKGARRINNVEQEIINNPENFPALTNVLLEENKVTKEEE
jgi:murein DD-endopeptidase MepM/ murein hydrolase activator NlpD